MVVISKSLHNILKIKAVILFPKPLHIYTNINLKPQMTQSNISCIHGQLKKSFAVDSFSHLIEVFYLYLCIISCGLLASLQGFLVKKASRTISGFKKNFQKEAMIGKFKSTIDLIKPSRRSTHVFH